MRKDVDLRLARKLHGSVPPDWYVRSIRENMFQRFWHGRRFLEVGKLVEPTRGEILDVGSADGTFTEILFGKSGADRVVGIDVLPASVNFAKRRFRGQKGFLFKVADAQNLPFEKGRFRAVFCLEVVEHVFDPRKVLEEIFRVLKKEGYAVILVPVEENPLMKVIWWGWTKGRGKIWKGTHLGVYGDGDLIKEARQVGFKVEKEKRFLLGMLLAVKLRK